jgi:excisionase family DNA binding protein
LLPAAAFPKDEASDRPDNVRKIRGLFESGRLDLNQRPLAPQAAPEAAQPSPDLPNPSDSFALKSAADVQGSRGLGTIRRNFATNLLPPIEQLLTVRQVAQLLGVCRATVYKWAATGLLPHVRIVNVIRIRREDLSALIALRSNR